MDQGVAQGYPVGGEQPAPAKGKGKTGGGGGGPRFGAATRVDNNANNASMYKNHKDLVQKKTFIRDLCR